MTAHAELHAALADLLTVAGRVSASDLGRPTPCTGWDVRRLLEHLVGWQQVFAACARDEAPPFDGESPTYEVTDRPVADLRESAPALTAALRQRGDVPVALPYRGVVGVAEHTDELVAETVLHTWDLAVAVGALFTPADDVLVVADRGLTSMLGASFAPLAFRARRSGGSGLAALLACSGRTG